MTAEEILSSLEACGLEDSVVEERFMGSKEIYVKVLWVLKQDTSFQDLKEALLKKEYEKAFNSGHTLKGIAGNLGFSKVLESLAPLVELLRDWESAPSKELEINAYMARLQEDYGKVEKVLDCMEGEGGEN